VGRFAARRVAVAVGDMGLTVGSVPHPSPANPIANRGWARKLTTALETIGIESV
jgi:single-strand selective monofunctional uracil DNA glycosylase